MSNNTLQKKKHKREQFTETFTLPIQQNIDTSYTNSQICNTNNPQFFELYKKIIELETSNKQLSSQIKQVNSNISSIRKKENRLLNRFGWTLIMANILLGSLAVIVVLSYFQFVYPTIQKNINSEGTFELIKWISFGILGFLITIWLSVLKFADYIKNRDQSDQE